uniref:Uncharacterized protein n=1 Tax=Ixodes scapularis TaxID=6945 RepID=A0A4D5RDE2_IXOSC
MTSSWPPTFFFKFVASVLVLLYAVRIKTNCLFNKYGYLIIFGHGNSTLVVGFFSSGICFQCRMVGRATAVSARLIRASL